MVRSLGPGSMISALKRMVGGGKAAYEDVEGLTVSLGVIYALLLPSAMNFQNVGFDEGILTKNFMLMLCTQPDFRSYVVETMTDPSTGDVGTYAPEAFDWNVTLGRGRVLNTKTILESDSSVWKWDGGHPEVLYHCGEVREIAATARVLYEHFPKWRLDAYALMNPEAPLWSDHLSAMNSFGMCIFMSGLVGSLMIYISLSLSSGREDKSGMALDRWNSLGFPLLGLNLLFLISAIIVLMFANDAYSESQDTFFLRSSRMAAYSKIALVAILLPIILIFIVFSILALLRSCRPGVDSSGTSGEAEESQATGAKVVPAYQKTEEEC